MHVHKTYKAVIGTTFVMLSLSVACSKYDTDVENPDSDWLSGGQQTVFDAGSGAFSHMFTGLPEYLERVHEIGDVQFEQTFVSAPAPVNPGLGPIFNNVSCVSCHIADGRGKVPIVGEAVASILFRISLPGTDAHGGPKPVPGFGGQLQNQAILGTNREAVVNIDYQELTLYFDDGTPYHLRKPSYTVSNAYISYPSNTLLSPRVAPPVFGLGLLNAISEESLLAIADENDANNDGISGRPNYVWDVVSQSEKMGRFGWKANQPSLLQQVAAAYNEDMGVTSFIFPQESSLGQQQYDNLEDDYEISDSLLHSVEFYIKTLAVPARRNVNDPIVVQGEQLFSIAGCTSCHKPSMRTEVNVKLPQLSNQLIHPYTDLLLHDMGEALADHRPDFKANGREWRTAPLWGIGLTERVNGHHNFLHDGRARNLMEAILWHGGEAEGAKNKVLAMSADEREALLAFLKSL